MKRSWQSVLLCTILGTCFFGCLADPSVTDEPSESNAPKEQVIEVAFDFSIAWDGNRVVVNGETNLPDGTEVITSVTCQDPPFAAQDRAVVESGRFRAGPLGPSSGLPPGTYEVGATMPYAHTQPPSVREIIGEKGEHLQGSLVDQNEPFGASISVNKSVRQKNVASKRNR